MTGSRPGVGHAEVAHWTGRSTVQSRRVLPLQATAVGKAAGVLLPGTSVAAPMLDGGMVLNPRNASGHRADACVEQPS
jgi:hypothetical protein